MIVYTIPPTTSFVDALAQGILSRYGHDPVKLAAVTILLPNRRAGRALREAFLRKTNGAPLLLPSIRPIGDVEEEALYLGTADPANTIPPAIAPLRRTLVLARYLMATYGDEYTTAQALSMATDLGRFLDNVETEGLSLDALDTLVPENYAQHWQINLTFLKDVLRRFWPAHLEAEGLLDAGTRRRLLIEAYTKNLQQSPPDTPVIAAGSTGSIPVTANLLKAVANLPQGCVVLPGLDTVLEDAHWADDIEEGHPQAGLARLLLHFDITRAQVQPWLDNTNVTPREVLISALMRPAAGIASWAKTPLPNQALDGIHLLEADTIDEEATAIACIMREYVEDTAAEKPCVLVTPDRILASRVAFQLNRWGIMVDDSGGTPLTNTAIGRWILLLCDVLANNLEPVSFLSLLKNSYAAGGDNWPSTAPAFRNFVRALDKHVLRGQRPEEGFTGLKFRAQKYPDIAAGIDALEKIFVTDASTPSAQLRTLVHLAETLATTKDNHGSHRLWAGEAGEAMAEMLASLFEQTDILPQLDWSGIRAVLEAAMQGISVRPRYGTHPKLAILGSIEARLYKTDTMILSGLNEGTWPKQAETDSWMSRGMRQNFGLPAPERSITLSSHDFAQGLGAKTVYLTRSKNRDNAPTTASRWLQRLSTLCAAQPEKINLHAHANKFLTIARMLDIPQTVTSIARPAPNPPLSARPKKLSVTEIAKWRRDPYYIYARHILGLRPLDPIATEPDAADRGTLIHKALEDFAKAYPRDLPNDAEQVLINIGNKTFEQARPHPDVLGHWWPRFVRMAKAIIPYETGWRTQTLKIFPEISATMQFGDFTLEGKADRIEHRQNGYAVIDYKSGTAPSNTAVKTGDEPQLTLLGAMLLNGRFNEALGTQTTPDTISTLSYWKTGGGEDVFKTTSIENANDICHEAEEGLKNHLKAYLHDGLAYTCWPDPENKLRDDYEYAHLARIPEWANADDTQDMEDAA